MADFFQTGAMATLHRLGNSGVERLEEQLRFFVQDMPIALVLPCHIDELGTPALRNILRELDGVDYLKQIIVGIDGASAAQWREAGLFSRNPDTARHSCGTMAPTCAVSWKSSPMRIWIPASEEREGTCGFALVMF